MTHDTIRSFDGKVCRVAFEWRKGLATRVGTLRVSQFGQKIVVSYDNVEEAIPIPWVKSIEEVTTASGSAASTETKEAKG